MNDNYTVMQKFLDMLKEFAISNPNKPITKAFVYSNLIHFSIDKKDMNKDVKLNYYKHWKERYKDTKNLQVDDNLQDDFCWFLNTYNATNFIKLYIPMDYDHLKEGAKQLFDFISSTNMIHQSKIASSIRNDNIVVRVNSLGEVVKIIDFISSTKYIQEGMLKANPFLPNYNGIGMVMDTGFSFNSELSKLLSSFIEMLKSYNRLDLVTVEQFNKFITKQKDSVKDFNLKDIYTLLEKTTSRSFKFEDFINFANDKLIDDYNDKKNRIIDPKHYLEKALKITEKYYEGNSKKAISQYLKGDADYFTRREGARECLIKYVKPGDLISIMRIKLQENNIPIPRTDQELIDKYLNIILDNQNNYKSEFEAIQTAYKNTLKNYDEDQAKYAFKEYYNLGEGGYFTNQYGDRTKLLTPHFLKNRKRIILSNIDLTNIDKDNANDILNRFIQTLQTKNNIK